MRDKTVLPIAVAGVSPRPTRIILVVMLTVILFGAGPLASSPWDPPCEIDPETLSELIERAHDEGSVSVIVHLVVPWEPEGALVNEQAVAGQRARIAAAQDDLESLFAEYEAAVYRRFKLLPFVAMRVDADTLSVLSGTPEICSIGEDSGLSLALPFSIPLVGADAAWNQGFSGDGTAIVIIDTGVDKDHPFLQKVIPDDPPVLVTKVVEEACFSTHNPPWWESFCPGQVNQAFGSGTGLPCPYNYTNLDHAADCAHGTHVAGIAAGWNGQQGSHTFDGVAKDADIIAIKVSQKKWLDEDQTIWETAIKTTDMAAALEHVDEILRHEYNIAAVNMSISQGTYDNVFRCDLGSADRRLVFYAVTSLMKNGIASVAASGNDELANKLGMPACISSAISVGNTTKLGFPEEVFVDDCGPDGSNSASFLDLLAPGSSRQDDVCRGDGILSSNAGGFGGGEYALHPGTSMSAPHVAGALAVLKERYPDDSAEDLLSRLIFTGTSIEDSRNSIARPRIQIDEALLYQGALDDVWLDFGYYDEIDANHEGSYFFPYIDLSFAVDHLTAGQTLRITSRHGSNCTHAPITISKAMTIQAIGGPIRIQSTPCE